MRTLLFSLRARLMIIVALATLPALCLILDSGLERRNDAIEEAEQNASQLLEHVSLYQDRLIEGTIQLIETLSQIPQVKERDDTRAAEIFTVLLKRNRQYENIAMVNPEGDIVASALPLERPTSVKDRLYFQKVFQKKKLFVSEYLIGRVAKVPLIVCCYPVISDYSGDVSAVIYASLNLRHIASMTSVEPLPANSNISVTDTWGTVLYNSQRNEEMAGKPFPRFDTLGLALAQHEGKLQTFAPNGREVLHLFHRVSNIADVGYIIIELDRQSILEGPNRILARNLASLGFAGAFAMIASWFLGSALVTRRVKLLTAAANRLMEGDLSARTGVNGGYGEIDRLAVTFDRMAEGLQQREEERDRAESALRASEEKYRLIVETATEGILTADKNSALSYANSVIAEKLGYLPGEMIGRPVTDFMFEEDIPQQEQVIRRRALGFSDKYERRFRHRDGYEIWFLVSAKPLYGPEGAFAGAFAMLADITDLKKAEMALRESRKKFEVLFEFAPEAIFLENAKGIITNCNKAAENMTGYSREELDGLPINELAPNALPDFKGTFEGAPAGDEYSTESVIQRKDGRHCHVHISAKIVEVDGEPTLMVIMSDITKLKELESELAKVQKLESLGVLAGGIAHDFNNILTAVVGNISLARFLAKDDQKVSGRLEEAERAAMRAKDLTFQLLTFAKGGAPVREIVSLPQVIRETCEFSLRGSGVGCAFEFPEDLWLVEADTGQISQVISNMAINAKQAMPDGGVLQIRARNLKNLRRSDLPVEPGSYVQITITDSGIGIPKEDLPKIFDPYFTTKKGGNGLGLSSCYSIINKHGGYITAQSEPGRGTTFDVFLPATDKKAESRKSADEVLISLKPGRILIMDDEEIIRDVAGQMLEQLGYEAAFAEEGKAAVSLYKSALREGNPFAAVILDLTIRGGLGGRDTIKLLKDIDPDVRAIVSSGYSNDPIMADYRKYGFREVVCKPYKLGDLGRVLMDVVGAARPG